MSPTAKHDKGGKFWLSGYKQAKGQGKMEAARRYLTHACMLVATHTIMQDAATNCKCMRLASLPSNSVTAASLAHMQAHMASTSIRWLRSFLHHLC